MFGLGGLIGMGLGGLAGATSSRGYKCKQFDQAVGADDRSKYASSGLSRLDEMASGNKPLVSQANINRMLSGQNARLEGTADTARTRATERSIQRGEGSRSGILDKRLGDVDRDLLNAKRQQAGPLMGKLAMMQPQMKLQALGQMMPFIQGQDQMAAGEHGRLEDLAAKREAAGSSLHRGLAGLAGGSGGLSGGMFG